MAKKLDLSGVKEFMFNHGEKVALGVCAFIAIVFGGWRLLEASGAGTPEGSSKPWDQSFKDTAADISNKIRQVAAPAKDKKDAINAESLVWSHRESRYVQAKYLEVPEVLDNKRRNPTALTILKDPDKIKLDYIRALTFAHEYDPQQRTLQGIVPIGGAGPGGANPMPMPMPMPMVKGPKIKGGPVVPVAIPDRLKAGKARQFVVVHAIFPMKDQVEEYRRAFKMLTQEELFKNREDLPRVVGINVVRYELTKPGGDVVSDKPTIIVNYDGKTLKMQQALEKMLREAMYDETEASALDHYIHEGLVMPLPQLAYGHYPKIEFKDWDLMAYEDDPAVAPKVAKQPMGNIPPNPMRVQLPGFKRPMPMPMPEPMANPMGGNVAAGAEYKRELIKEKALQSADPILAGRLFGKHLEKDFNVFHALGQIAPPEDAKGVNGGAGMPMVRPNPMPMPAGMQGGPNQNLNANRFFNPWDLDPPAAEGMGINGNPMPMPMPKGRERPMPGAEQPGGAGLMPFAPWDRDALMRFVDADVQPGHTYAYAIQVRLANPNFGKKDKVQADFLAQVAELADAWVTTPSITIPHDYFLYAVDQQHIDEMLNANKRGPSDIKLPRDATTFQVHQWIKEEKTDLVTVDTYVIGDWAIAGRQVVHKGERIGVSSQVPVPVWRADKDAFEVPVVKGNPRLREPDKLGVRITLKPEAEAPVLVDFSGGRRLRPNGTVEEETAVEALIMTPDGKLRVQNSRDDTDAMQPEAYSSNQPPRATSRQDRWQGVQRRVLDVLQGAAPAAGPGNPMNTRPPLPGRNKD